jgi:hypothetical protein
LTNEQKTTLRSYAEALPIGALVPVPREWLMALLREPPKPRTPPEPRLLTPEEVARRLQVEVQWVNRGAKKWPLTTRLGRLVRFESAGFERWLARQDSHRLDPCP